MEKPLLNPEVRVCLPCQQNRCFDCTDIAFILADRHIEFPCKCMRPGHSTEPNTQQILDPDTNTVYAPGLKVDEDGTVTRFRRAYGLYSDRPEDYLG